MGTDEDTVPAVPKKTRMVRSVEASERTGLSRKTIFRLCAAGKFPAPRRLTESALGWLESDLDAWIESRPIIDTAELL
jgi:prophage regulatory protein